MNKYLKNTNGFTLIELMIVIAIIAILAAIAIPAFSGVLSDAKKTKVASEAKNLYSLAHIHLTNDLVENRTQEISDDDEKEIIKDAGLKESDASVSYDTTSNELVAVVTNGDFIATATNTGITVEPE